MLHIEEQKRMLSRPITSFGDTCDQGPLQKPSVCRRGHSGSLQFSYISRRFGNLAAVSESLASEYRRHNATINIKTIVRLDHLLHGLLDDETGPIKQLYYTGL